MQLLQRCAVPARAVRIGHEADSVAGVAAVEDRHLVANRQIDEPRADSLQLMRGAADLSVRAVGLKVVTEHALPVGFLASVDGVPVPVLNHVCAVGDTSV